MATNTSVSITRKCPKGPCRGRLRLTVDHAGAHTLTCPVCKEPVKADVPEALYAERSVTRCALCPGREFWVKKDFPQKAGLALVVVFGLVASVFYAWNRVMATFATLGALVILDAIIFVIVGRVTVCYRCRAEYRGVDYNPGHQGFDLATSEKYD